MSTAEAIRLHCRALRLPTIAAVFEQTSQSVQQENWSFEQGLLTLLEQEVTGRQQRRIERLTKQAQLPPGKSLDNFDLSRLPLALRRQLPTLGEGHILEQAHNILFFGLPGTGKTHAAASLGYEWVQKGYPVLFIPTYKLVGRLLKAKQNYDLERELRRLDRFAAVILDDIGYVQQSQAEMEVLFTFLAERYERRSVVITSNLVFSQWDQIFKNPLTTAAAIDRLVHHSVIIEFGADIRSMRAEQALARNQQARQHLPSDQQTPTLTAQENG